MTKYHINNETGRVNICRAKEGNCPLKNSNGEIAEHFDNKEAAIAFNEQKLNKAHKPFVSLSKPRKERLKGITEEENKVLTQRMIEEFKSMEAQLDLSEQNALSHYTFAGSSSMNRLLHNEPRDYENTPEKIEQNWKDIKALDKIIEKFGNSGETRTLYRYLNLDKKTDLNEVLKKVFKENGTYTDTGFMSTTEDLSFIAAYAKKHSRNRKFIVLEIETNKGISLQQQEERVGDLLTFEKERLLPRDMKFTVDEISTKSIKIDESRQKLLAEFNGYHYPNGWQGEKEAAPIAVKTFQFVKLSEINTIDE